MRSLTIGAGALALAGAVALAVAQTPQSSSSSRMNRDIPGANAIQYDRWQSKKLPALPNGMTLAMVRQGDSVFHGAGGCTTCHGPNAMGLPDKGSSLSLGLHFVPLEWQPIDSLVTAGIPEAITRSSIAMPPRGAASNLDPEQIRQVAAYVWAVAQTADEPWPGGHRSHGEETARGVGEP